MQEFISILQIIGAGQGFFLGAVLLSTRENRIANSILSLFIILSSLPMLAAYFSTKGYYTSLYYLSFVLFPAMFLNGPLIFLYTRSMTTGIKNIWLRNFLHLVPALATLVIFYFFGIHYGFTADVNIDMKNILIGRTRELILPILFLSIMSGLVYTILSLRMLYYYGKSIREYFSNIIKLRMLWLNILLGLLFLMFFNMTLFNWLDFLNIIHLQDMTFVYFIPPMFNIVTIYITAFFVLRQPDIFRYTHEMAQELGIAGNSPISDDTEIVKIKYEKSNIDDKKKGQYLAVLLKYMEDEKPYLDEDITLKNLSDELSIPPHHLSIIINERLGQNFFTFINNYRIKDIKTKLADPDFSEKNILELALSSGFNSKSTFNNTFKNLTGMTPTEYRKHQSSDAFKQ